jgi:hypothetical protein
MTQKRTVCLNCIDGRIQIPVIQWIKENYEVDHVDMITEPGIDGVLADNANSMDEIKRKVGLSIERNNASGIFIAGHHDCRANPVSEAVHREHIRASLGRLKKEFPEMTVTGLWVNNEWKVERV